MKFSKYFNVKDKNFDFFDLDLDTDTELFIDPYKIIQGTELGNQFCKRASSTISDCFAELIKNIRNKKDKKALEIAQEFHEYGYTHLGYGQRNYKGKGLGKVYGEDFVNNIKSSKIIQNKSLQFYHLPLIADNIADDRVSDITSKIISLDLVNFTQKICNKYNIETREREIPIWDAKSHSWRNLSVPLPFYKNEPIILVPKDILAKRLRYGSKVKFLMGHILEYEQKRLFDQGKYREVGTGKRKERKYLYKNAIMEMKGWNITSKKIVEILVAHPEYLSEYKWKR